MPETNEQEHRRLGKIPDESYDLYVYGIKSKAEKENITYQAAAEYFIQDAQNVGGHEHIGLIQAALKFLLGKK